jgi:archaellum component FlaC
MLSKFEEKNNNVKKMPDNQKKYDSNIDNTDFITLYEKEIEMLTPNDDNETYGFYNSDYLKYVYDTTRASISENVKLRNELESELKKMLDCYELTVNLQNPNKTCLAKYNRFFKGILGNIVQHLIIAQNSGRATQYYRINSEFKIFLEMYYHEHNKKEPTLNNAIASRDKMITLQTLKIFLIYIYEIIKKINKNSIKSDKYLDLTFYDKKNNLINDDFERTIFISNELPPLPIKYNIENGRQKNKNILPRLSELRETIKSLETKMGHIISKFNHISGANIDASITKSREMTDKINEIRDRIYEPINGANEKKICKNIYNYFLMDYYQNVTKKNSYLGRVNLDNRGTLFSDSVRRTALKYNISKNHKCFKYIETTRESLIQIKKRQKYEEFYDIFFFKDVRGGTKKVSKKKVSKKKVLKKKSIKKKSIKKKSIKKKSIKKKSIKKKSIKNKKLLQRGANGGTYR